jgi:hypothetical protein
VEFSSILPLATRINAMNQVTDADKPSNPHQAVSIADLITPNQLHWLTVAAESVGMDKDETAIALFGCSVYSLSRAAASQLEQYVAQVKMNAAEGHDHDHACAVCGDGFTCNQPQCHAELSRYCQDCKADLFTAA